MAVEICGFCLGLIQGVVCVKAVVVWAWISPLGKVALYLLNSTGWALRRSDYSPFVL